MTNALGHRCASGFAHEDGKYAGITLGAYRRGKRVPWVPGALVDVWTACARQESATGVPWPHAYFIQTKGGDDGGHVLCPSCREDVKRVRAAQPTAAKPVTVGQLRLF